MCTKMQFAAVKDMFVITVKFLDYNIHHAHTVPQSQK